MDAGEADDLVASLKRGPVAFDMEWRMMLKMRRSVIKQVENKTAVIQVADAKGTILVIQVFGMESTCLCPCCGVLGR